MEMKEENALSKEFTLALTDDAEGVQFRVRGCPIEPGAVDKTVLWVRARDLGGEWGQSAYVEVFRVGPTYLIDDYDYESNMILPGTLWMEPGKVYTIEVTPEGLEDPQLMVRCIQRAPLIPKDSPAPIGDSVIENPALWLAFFVVGLLIALFLVIR